MLQESSDDKILYTESDQKKSILESDLSLENVQLDITHPQSSINKSEIHDGVITIKDETAFVTNAQSFEGIYKLTKIYISKNITIQSIFIQLLMNQNRLRYV